jgi:hypothetical protein
MYVSLVPAYGRDYKSKKEVLSDWDANKDFIIQCYAHPYDGKPVNKSSAVKSEKYSIRYARLTKSVNVTM